MVREVIVGVTAVLAACALPQRVEVTLDQQMEEEVQRRVAVALQEFQLASEHWAGMTLCGSVGRAWSPHDVMDTQWFPGIKAHEAVHVAKAQEFASCAEFWEWSLNPLNRLQHEAEAYCVQLATDLQLGLWSSQAAGLQRYGVALLQSYPWPFDITAASTTTLIETSCDLNGDYRSSK